MFRLLIILSLSFVSLPPPAPLPPDADRRPPLLVPAPGPPLALQAGTIAAADLDADGKPDLLVRGQGLHVLLGDGTGRFRAAPGSPVVLPKDAGEIAVGDVNEDGKLDVAIAAHNSYAVELLLGDGAGRFAKAPGSPVPAKEGKRPHTHGLALGDLDGDGDLDLVTANQEDGDVAVLLGDGRGGFRPAPRSPFPCGPSPYPIALADLDGDARLDLAVPNMGAGTVTVLKGDGRGGFAPAPRSPYRCAGPRPFFVAAGDLDGDGRPDLVATQDDETVATVLRNAGRGGFIPAPASPLQLGNNAWVVAVADMDRDGRADVVAAAKDAVRVFLGDGRGGLHPAPGSPFPTGKGTWSLAVADFNGDGKPDVAATCVEEPRLTVLLGR